MWNQIVKKLVGTKHEREMKRLQPLLGAINGFEPKVKALGEAELRGKTAEFRQRLDQGASLDDILPEAFAVCREAGRRVLGMRHYDVQLIGGITLHRGRIAEMKTGEGKTLVATLAAYLNALPGKGVHVVTVNDYLARRDAEWMSKLYGYLGLTTGVVVGQQGDTAKKRAYRCDITYGQNNEFGFDYLRDNMKFSIFEYAQRDLNFAIVDEVDSILIDEARTPLIISGRGREASHKYAAINGIVPKLRRDEHFTVDEKQNSVTLTDAGIELSQRELFAQGLTEVENLYEPVNLESLHILQQLLKAHALYKRDQQYMVAPDGKIMIIDEFTGRVLPGRRWSDGLHQAVEAKENVPIQEESATVATISFQNLFRLYKKLSGMTGTADTEAAEFHKIYNLECTVIPTNKPILRQDREDLVYMSEPEKFRAVVAEIQDRIKVGQPVLVGTTSVEKSDALSRMLTKAGVNHNVLNAKQHEREAYVVAQAGRKGAVTVATNMAGRGTDILLGGNAGMIARFEVLQSASEELRADPKALEEAIAEATAKYATECEREKAEVLELGGLHIIGTERHESRRIDNQLRGRGGRQGDPGGSRFYLSLEDDLMRIFAGDRMQVWMDKLGMEQDVPIEHKWVTKAVENAQTKVEQRNFDIRKHMLEYDDVMNQQRKSVYALRRQVLQGQYRSELTKEERERGVEPRVLIKDIDPALREVSEPLIDEMIKIFASDPLPADATQEMRVAWREAARAQEISKLEKLAVQPLAQQLYEIFGCHMELEGYEKDPQGAYERMREEIPRSLTEQRERLLDLLDETIGYMVEHACPPRKHVEDWDLEGLKKAYTEMFGLTPEGLEQLTLPQEVAQKLYQLAEAEVEQREGKIGKLLYLRLFRNCFLQDIDNQWLEHLQSMDSLRDGIGLRGYGQRDPKKEYQKEGFALFQQLTQQIKGGVINKMFHFVIEGEGDVEELEERRKQRARERQNSMQAVHPGASPTAGGEPAAGAQPGAQAGAPGPNQAAANGDPAQLAAMRQAQAQAAAAAGASRHVRRRAAALGRPPGAPGAPQAEPAQQTVRRGAPKLGRNDPCHCGSGKKYKNCHLRSDQRITS